jgi:hypothetical protein
LTVCETVCLSKVYFSRKQVWLAKNPGKAEGAETKALRETEGEWRGELTKPFFKEFAELCRRVRGRPP